MAYLRHQDAHNHFRDKVVEGIKQLFPIEGRQQSLHVEDVTVADPESPDNIRAQYNAKMAGQTWAAPVHATMVLKNKEGQVINRTRLQVADLPQITKRYSYIVNGQEYQVDNQWQLKPGVYTQRRQNGELESRFNVVGRAAFDMVFHPDTKQFILDYNDSKIPLYPIMRAMGHTDEQLEKLWGKEILDANKSARKASSALEQFAKTTQYPGSPLPLDLEAHVRKVMEESKLNPRSTEITLGKSFGHITGDTLQLATRKLLKVQAGHPEDDRDSLIFKELRSVGDFAADFLKGARKDIKTKVDRRLDKATTVRQALPAELLNKPIREVFTNNTAARTATQINPAEMLSASLQTTILGPGGIKSERSVTGDAKLINPSHFGFIDPVNTPEGCFDAETQVFTQTGWVSWPEVTPDTVFACRVDGRLEYHKAQELQKYEYTGLMYGVRKPWLEYLVTPNHRVLCRPYAAPGKSEYRVVRADQVHNKPRMFPMTHEPLLGSTQEFFELPYVEGNNSSVHVAQVPICDWAELMGWFLSEGSCTYVEATSLYHVKLFQSDTVNEENCDRIEMLLDRLPWRWSVAERENGRLAYVIGVKQLAKYMSQFGRCDQKFIPEELFTAPIAARKALLSALLAGDGRQCATHKNKRQSSEYYTTTSKQLAVDVQRLAIGLGKAATLHTYVDKRRESYLDTHEVCILRDTERSAEARHGHYYTKEYSGMVYCATVPGSFLYVRRNDKHPIWMGNSKTGIVLRLASGVQKVGTEPRMPMYDLKTGKVEQVDPYGVLKNKVVLADQVKWVDGKPVPLAKSVRMLGDNNEPTAGPMHEARYVMRRPTHMLNITTNLIPFVNNTNGARAGYGSRHLEQAISLVHREAPLVQSSTGVTGDMGTFDRLVGSSAAHRSMVDGHIVKVHPDGIHVQDAKGDVHEVQLYNHFPLNDLKSMMHSEPLVKVGDKVKAGQVIADTNYTRNGTLALGTNLRVGFLPYHGYNFEDGLVISESAAQKLASQHMYKHELDTREGMIFNPTKFKVQHPTAFSREQFAHIQEDGTVKVGTRVKPGDPLVIAMQPYQVKDRTGMGAIRKGLAGVHTDSSLKWEGEHEGEVVSVHKSEGKIRVHVRTVEAMRPGDKMCFDAQTEVLTSIGWKKVADVTLDDSVCCLEDGEHITYQTPTATHVYATGGRMYRLISQQVDVFVTQGHQLFVRPRGAKSFGLHTPDQAFGRRVRYKKNGVWVGAPMEDVSFSELRVKAGQGGRTFRWLPEKVLPARTYLMLLGMYLSEGNLRNYKGTYGIQFTQCKPEGVAEIERALQAHDVPYSRCGEKFTVYSKQLMEHFAQFGKAADKFIPAEIFEATPEELQVLFHWLMWGDGHRLAGRPVNYTTTSKQLADDVQRLCLHIGYAANIACLPAHEFHQNGKCYWAADRYMVRIVTKKLTPQVNHGHVHQQKVHQESWIEGYNEPVYCVTVPTHVLYVRRNGKAYWSGNSNRAGGKGIVTTILPDKEMPHTKDGKPIDVAFNPAGIPGRMNVGQVLEVATGKIAQKTGKPYIVQNFEAGTADVLERVKGELKQHHLSDTEELFDPHTGKSLGNILVGPQHMFKLVHQIDKKLAVRPGMTLPGVTSEAAYTPATLQPAGGGHAGGQAVGALGVYSLLAHGARANLREMQSFKSEGPDPQTNPAKAWPSQHNAVWAAIQQGTPLPTPRPTFAFKKFENMLKGAGVNIEKKGHEFILGPLTDKQVLSMSNGELKDPTKAVAAKLKGEEPMPLPGGIFDERITGGHGGSRWSHIALAEPIPNPIFEGPIKHLTGLTKGQYEDIIYGKKGVLSDGSLVEAGKGKTGGAGIKVLLDRIQVPEALKKAEALLKKVPDSKVDKTLKQVKYLRALNTLGVKTPSEAYILHNLPVIPPANRPLAILPSGDIRYEDINGLYKEFGQVNQQLKDPTLQKGLSDKRKEDLRKDLYDGVRAIMGAHIPYKDAKNKGLLHVIQGSTPKEGFFQDVLTSRRQDLSMRSTIIPEPALGLDEAGLPKHAALKLFAPFVVRNLVQNGAAAHALEAQKKLASAINGKDDPLVWKALEATMQERPVLLKRDPALHQYSVQAFKAKPVTGNAIRIHPLVTGGFGADFDGNCFVGSTKIVLKIGVSGATLDGQLLTLLEKERGMKFAKDTTCFVSDGAVVVQARMDEVPHLVDTAPRRDKNGALVYDVPSDISVWSYDHAHATGSFEPVTHLTIEEACAVVKVTTRGFEVTASANESLCVYDHTTGEVRDACPKDSVGALCPVVRHVPTQKGLPEDAEVGWMLGAFASDGFITGATVIGYSKKSDAHRDAFYRALARLFPIKKRATYSEVHEGVAVEGISTKDHFTLAASDVTFFQQFYAEGIVEEGRSCLRKKLPNLASYSHEGLLGILAGLLDGDGAVSLSNAKGKPQFMASIATSAPGLVQSITELCTRLGIRVGCTTTHPKEGRLQAHDAYTLTLSTVDLQEYLVDLPLYTPSAQQAVQFALEHPPSKDDFDVVPVPTKVLQAATTGETKLCIPVSTLRTLQTAKSERKPHVYISRAVALVVLQGLETLAAPLQVEMGLAAWGALVRSSVRWDVVTSVEDMGVDCVYDLCVPTTKIFAVNGGLIVWDTMSAYVPVTHEAVREARKMYPSQNLFSEATGEMMYQPSKENVVGLYQLTKTGKQTAHKFGTPTEVIAAFKKGNLDYTDVVHVDGKPSTAGRALLASVLPTDMQHKMLYDLGTQLDKKNMSKLLTEVAQKHKVDFGVIVNRIKDLGNGAVSGTVNLGDAKVATVAQTLSLKDFEADKETRNAALAAAAKKIVAIKNSKMSEAEKESKAIEVWEVAGKQMQEVHIAKMKQHPNNLFTMYAAGIKPGWDQYKQMALAPMLLKDSTGRVVPSPVTRSYGEGLDISGYWTHLHGTRRGTVRKVQEVQDPGYMTKLLQNTACHIHVDQQDCGTSRGVAMHVGDKEVHDRYLQQDFKTSELHVPAGTLLTPDLVGKMRAADKSAQIVVRSPLRCESEKGVCAHCAGLAATGTLHQIGDAVGVQAVHALGERAVQLTLKEFHCLHEHTTVLVRQGTRKYHTTLGQLFASYGVPTVDGNEEVHLPEDLYVWTRGEWTRVRKILRHPQQQGTSMVLLRTRSGHFIISQDNHPHMLRDNRAVCSTCNTYPKKSNGGKQYYCRKCQHTWEGAPKDNAPVCAVEPAHVCDKSHRGFVLDEPAVDATAPVLSNGWLAGIYCAEGWIQVVNKTNTVGVGFGQSAGWILERIGDELRQEYPTQHQSRCGGGLVLYNGRLGQEYMRSFGRYSRNKGLSAGWTGHPKEWLYDFVAGLLDGDGTISRNEGGRWSTATLYTTSALLAHQVRWILATLGVTARVCITTHRDLTAHQGLAVKFTITQAVSVALARSEKLLDVPARPNAHEERFSDVVDYVRPYFFDTPPVVYDLSTDATTLAANGLWTHNSGGVTGSTGMSSSLDRMQQLTDLPEKIPDAATLAMVGGKIEKIEKDATGTKVWVNGQVHHVGKDRFGHALITHAPNATSTVHDNKVWAPPTVGMYVEAGQHLSDPTRTVVNPRDLYAATKSVERLQNHLTDEIYKLYKDEGTKRKHVETIVRAMTSVTRIKNPGDSTLLRGDVHTLAHVNKLNQELKNKIEHEPVIRGVEMLPHDLHTDWMAKLQHERLRNTIMDAAATLGVSNIHGNHPISALAYGAEFGLTKVHANQPGMSHLADIPEHHY